jgi:DNA-binding transcriptional regulator GbsR (MarR family)
MQDLKQWVEDIAVIYEQFGKTPMASRVFSYLLVANPPHQSFDEIREFLGASKGAVSNAINGHLQDGSISYKTFSGDRKRYFYLDLDNWKIRVEEMAKKILVFNDIMEEVLVQRDKSTNGEFTEKLRKTLNFQKFLTLKIEEALREWEGN